VATPLLARSLQNLKADAPRPQSSSTSSTPVHHISSLHTGVLQSHHMHPRTQIQPRTQPFAPSWPTPRHRSRGNHSTRRITPSSLGRTRATRTLPPGTKKHFSPHPTVTEPSPVPPAR
jgi:Leucine-rich repeat (LRR) protein